MSTAEPGRASAPALARVRPPFGSYRTGRRGYAPPVSSAPPDGFEPYTGSGDFLDLIGPVYARGEGEGRVFGMRIEDRHRNVAGAAHGGLLATLVDFSLGRAINAGSDADGAVTVSLTTDYLGPVKMGEWVEAHTEVERLGGRLAFADCSLRVGDREAVRGRAVFALAS